MALVHNSFSCDAEPLGCEACAAKPPSDSYYPPTFSHALVVVKVTCVAGVGPTVAVYALPGASSKTLCFV